MYTIKKENFTEYKNKNKHKTSQRITNKNNLRFHAIKHMCSFKLEWNSGGKNTNINICKIVCKIRLPTKNKINFNYSL